MPSSPFSYDRVQETTATTGTGAYTLAGAMAGYQSFAAVGDGNSCSYCATDGTSWEVGRGTYTLSGTTLSRDTILASSNSGSAVNWSAGTRSIFLDIPAVLVAEVLQGTTSQPLQDQWVEANETAVLYADPLYPASGVLVNLLAGALLILDPRDGNEEFPQIDPEPENAIRVFGGNYSGLVDQFPLILDSGILFSVDTGSLLNLDGRADDIYSGITTSRPGRDVYLPDLCSSSPMGPFILDSGRLVVLAGASSSDSVGSLLNLV